MSFDGGAFDESGFDAEGAAVFEARTPVVAALVPKAGSLVSKSSGADYATWRFQVGTSRARLLVPNVPWNGRLIFYHHGNSGDADTLTATHEPVAAALTQAGFMMAASDDGGPTNWGNPTAVRTAFEVYQQIVDWGFVPTGVGSIGASMGGLVTLQLAARQIIPNHTAFVLSQPVCDLGVAHARAGWTSQVRTAHGVASDGSDFVSVTALRDPLP